MGLVSKSIPNLINGISQQPPALRLPTQGEVQENGLSDVVDGLKKRPPTKFIKTLQRVNSAWVTGALTASDLETFDISNCFITSYKRSETEQYTVIIDTQASPAVIYVYDINGNINYQSGVGSWDWSSGTCIFVRTNTDDTSYLTNITKEDIATTSIIDATFLVNKKKRVLKNPERKPEKRDPSALIYLKSVNYGRIYNVKATSLEVGGAYVEAEDETDEPNADRTNETQLKTSEVIKELRSAFYGSANFSNNTGNSSGDIGSIEQETFTSTIAINTEYLENGEKRPRLDSNGNHAVEAVRVIDLPSTLQGAQADGSDLIVVIGGTTYAYDDSGYTIEALSTSAPYPAHGGQETNKWRWYNQARTKILLPTTVLTETLIAYTYSNPNSPSNYAVGQNFMNRRPSVQITKLPTDQNGQPSTIDTDVKLVVSPTGFNGEPYFVVTSPSNGVFGDFDITATDDDGGTNLQVFKGVCKSFTSLPNSCIDGYQLQVSGDNNKKEDNFYVEFSGGSGGGYWKETVGDGLMNSYDLSTMPHTLKQEMNVDGNLYFTFGAGSDNGGTWRTRKAGDDDTNPFPSFVGDTINDIFFHRSRLGVISGENVIFSETNNYLNFFRTTVRGLLDTDPIDVAVSQNEVSELKAALPIQDSLLLFSELNQFTLSATQLLTPSEVTIDQSTKFECSLDAYPVGAGNSVFFAVQNGTYAGIREYFTDGDTEIKDATLVTSHVPKYLAGKVRKMMASTNESMLICLTTDNKKEAYVYKWYNSDNERLQSSWSKWIFDTDILDIAFNNSTLFFTFADGAIERMDLAPVSTETVVSISDTVSGSGLSFESFTLTGIISGWFGSGFIRTDDTQPLANDNIMTSRWNTVSNYLEVKIDTDWEHHNDFTHYNIGGQQFAVADATVTDTFIFNAAKSYVWDLTQTQINALNALTTVIHSYVLNGIGSGTTTQAASNFEAFLDHRIRLEAPTLGGTVNSLTGVYSPTQHTEYVDYRGKLIAKGDSAEALGKVYTALTNNTHLENNVQVNDYVYIGEPYTFKYKLSEQVFTPQQGDTTELSRFQLRTVSFNYNDTGTFDITTKSTGRDAKITTFTGRILGQADNILGYSAVVDSGSFKVGVQSQAKETEITITNGSHLPCTFQSAEWEGFVVLRNQRL